MKKITILFSAVCVLMNLSAAVYKVSPNGAGQLDGSSWANAMPVTSVQPAIEANPSANNEFWLSKGTYVTKVFDYTGALKLPVCKLYGGFSGDNESETIDSRNWMVNQTILDGGTSGIQMMKYGGGANPAFSYDGSVYVDGMVFYRNGLSTKDYVLTFNTYKGVLTVVNCIFTECVAKRGVVQMNNAVAGTKGGLNVINCLFRQNTINGATASISSAIVQAANTDCNVVNCTMANNTISTQNPSGQLGIISGQGNSTFNVANNIIYGQTGVSNYKVSNIEALATASVDNTFTFKNNASDISISETTNILLTASPFLTGAYTLDKINGATCINSGDNSSYLSAYPLKDLAANLRVAENVIDLGAYETQIVNSVKGNNENTFLAYRNEGTKIIVKCESGEVIHVYTLQGSQLAEVVASAAITTIDLPVKGTVILKTSKGAVKL